MRRCQRRRAPSWRRVLRLREVARWAAERELAWLKLGVAAARKGGTLR